MIKPDRSCVTDADSVGAQAIISRDTKGFKRSIVKVLDPTELLAFLEAG